MTTLDSRPPSDVEHGRRRRPKQHRRAPLIAVLLLVALSITLAGIFPFRQVIAQQRQVENTRGKLGALVDENATLEDQVAALQSEPEVERLAREQYGLVNPGETPYAVVQPEVETTPSAPPAVEPIDERTLLEQVWDWMTGRDLVPDE
jgi:cell division protein FtsB